MNTCATCHWFDQSCSPESKQNAELELHGDSSGLCRRYPPVLDSTTRFDDEDIVTESPAAFVQPLTWSRDYCGEHSECQAHAMGVANYGGVHDL